MADFSDYEPKRVDQFTELSSVTDNDLVYVEKASDSRGHRVKAKNILPNGAVTSDKLATHSVTGMKIAPNAVGNDAIAEGVVNTQHITPYAVTTEKLANKAVTNLKIAADAVGNAELADGAVTESKIAPLNVTTGKIAANAVTSEKLSSDLQNTIANKANIDGYYDEMSVGSAEQLLSNIFEPDNALYLFRTSGGSLEIGDRVYEDALVGASMAWNQLLNKDNYPASSGVFTNNGDGSITANGTASSQETFVLKSGSGLFKYNHIYYVVSNLNATEDGANNKYELMLSQFIQNGNNLNIYRKAQLAKCENQNAASANNVIQIIVRSGYNAQNIKFVPQIYDISTMFPSDIVNYAYTLEQSEAGSGIAWLKSQGFFLKGYYAYNAGQMMSVKTSAKKVVGFNQWDEVWQLGSIYITDGTNASSTSKIRSKNHIPVFPSTTYCISWGSGYAGDTDYIYYYDVNKNYISYATYRTSSTSGNKATFTTPSNACYVRFIIKATSYSNDICINFHWDGERDGEYEAYEEHTYPLDSDLELRGVPTLVDGKIKYSGDIYASDGTVTRRRDEITIDGENVTVTDWGVSNPNGYPVYVTVNGLNKNGVAICDRFVKNGNSVSSMPLYTFMGSGGAPTTMTFILPSTVDSRAAANTWFKNNPTTVVFTKSTPTTETADPYTNPQIIDNWGTEEFVDTRDVPIPVGHESRYLPDLKAKLESAPNNPSTNGKYFLQYQNGEATYVPVPSEVPQTPSEDGTYVLKATVTSGTATLSWVAEE